jgi:hypothetical protein
MQSQISTVTCEERGWPGHFIGANSCHFRRNTLLTKLDVRGDVRIVVSTVGMMVDPINRDRFMEIGFRRHYETMVFMAEYDGRYWDADVTKEVTFDSPWCVEAADADDVANAQHDMVVNEIKERMEAGEFS